MKRPYYKEYERFIIYMNTTKGQFMLIHLAWMKFKRSIYYLIKEVISWEKNK